MAPNAHLRMHNAVSGIESDVNKSKLQQAVFQFVSLWAKPLTLPVAARQAPTLSPLRCAALAGRGYHQSRGVAQPGREDEPGRAVEADEV